jgi:thymidylate synthase (FAD)
MNNVCAQSGPIGKVELIDHMGDELKVVNAAKLCRLGFSEEMDEKAEKLLLFLLREKHLSVFEHCVMTFHVICPIFVRTHLFRYRTASVTEWSHRGVDKEPEIWTPSFGQSTEVMHEMNKQAENSIALYKDLIAKGVRAEIARAVLPQGMMTNFLFTIDLRNFMHIWDERSKPSAQEETRAIVKEMARQAAQLYPLVGKTLGWDKEEET